MNVQARAMEIGALLFYGRDWELSMHRPRQMMNMLCGNGRTFSVRRVENEHHLRPAFFGFMGGLCCCM